MTEKPSGWVVARRVACGPFTLVESDNVRTAWSPDKAKSVSDCQVTYENALICCSAFVIRQFLRPGIDVLDILLTDSLRRPGVTGP